jgi:ubiquinone/menaquinone biosynthesis C-methylase UbiE
MVAARDSSYDAVFDFGIIHHIERWMDALCEVERVLRPGGIFYAEEPLRKTIDHPITRRLTRHPNGNRFDSDQFAAGLQKAGLITLETKTWWEYFAWFVAVKPVGEK